MLIATLGLACRRGRSVQDANAEHASVTDGGKVSPDVPDGGLIATDGGVDSADAGGSTDTCDSLVESSGDGGLTWTVAVPAVMTQDDGAQWTALSDDPECADIRPGRVPAQLSWNGPDASSGAPSCDPAVIDGNGDLAVFSLYGTSAGNTFLRANGSGATIVTNTSNEMQMLVAPRANGFVLASYTWHPWCSLVRVLQPDATAGRPLPVDGVDPSRLQAIVPNPLGGYVQGRTTTDAQPSPHLYVLQLRWVDDALQPLGDWHTVTTWQIGTENLWQLLVDQKGKAFVLSFVYPPSFGRPPDPSTWSFSARWADVSGPATAPFEPVAPKYTASRSGAVYFANWGRLDPLRDGGFAAFHAQTDSNAGTVSPTGWYAFYPSAESTIQITPSWLASYDGSLQLLQGSRGYGVLQRDFATCARTILLLSVSGKACFSLPIAGSNVCNAADSITPDGTVVLEGSCRFRWWPRLASSQK